MKRHTHELFGTQYSIPGPIKKLLSAIHNFSINEFCFYLERWWYHSTMHISVTLIWNGYIITS